MNITIHTNPAVDSSLRFISRDIEQVPYIQQHYMIDNFVKKFMDRYESESV